MFSCVSRDWQASLKHCSQKHRLATAFFSLFALLPGGCFDIDFAGIWPDPLLPLPTSHPHLLVYHLPTRTASALPRARNPTLVFPWIPASNATATDSGQRPKHDAGLDSWCQLRGNLQRSSLIFEETEVCYTFFVACSCVFDFTLIAGFLCRGVKQQVKLPAPAQKFFTFAFFASVGEKYLEATPMLECALLDHCRAHFADVAEHIFLSMGSENQPEAWIDDVEDGASIIELAVTPAWIQQFNSYEQNFWRCLRAAPVSAAFSTMAERESELSSQIKETDADVHAASTSTTTAEDDNVPVVSTRSESALPSRRLEQASILSPLARLASFFGSTLILLGRTEDALVVLNASLEGLRQVPTRDLFGEAQLRRLLAVVLMGQRRIDEAEVMLNEALDIYTTLKSSFGLALVFCAQSHLHRMMLRHIDRSVASKSGRDEKAARLERLESRAIELCARALDLFTQINHLPGQIASTRWLAHHGPQGQRHAYFDRLTLLLQALTKKLFTFSQNLRADQESVELPPALKLQTVSTPPTSARAPRMLSSSSSAMLLGYETDPLLSSANPSFIGAANGSPYDSVHSTYVSHWAGDDMSLHIQTVLGHMGSADVREATHEWISSHALRLSRLRVALLKKWMPLSSNTLNRSASSSSMRGTPMSALPSLASLQSPITSTRPPRAPSSSGATPSAAAASSTGKFPRRMLQSPSHHAAIMCSPRGIGSHRPLSAAHALSASPASVLASMHFKHSRY
jgi:hypothetical protein